MFVQDNFLADGDLRRALADASVWRNGPRLRWWDGWWVSEPNDLWQQLVRAIWEPNGVAGEVRGFEYWTNQLDSDHGLGWHQDKDEELSRVSGTLRHPSVGTIYYGYPHQLQGGFLEIACEKTLTDAERIAPVYNRLIIFNASLPHRVTRIYSGLRYAFLVNLWDEKPRTFESSDTPRE